VQGEGGGVGWGIVVVVCYQKFQTVKGERKRGREGERV